MCSALTLRHLPSRTPQTKYGRRATSGSERTTPYSSSISLFTRALLPSKYLRRLLVSIYRNKLKTQRSSHSSFSFAAAFVLSSNPRTTRRRFSTEMRAPASDACAPSSRSPAASTAVRNPSFSPYLYTYTHGGRVATYRVFTTIARRLNLSLPLLSRSPFVLYLFFLLRDEPAHSIFCCLPQCLPGFDTRPLGVPRPKLFSLRSVSLRVVAVRSVSTRNKFVILPLAHVGRSGRTGRGRGFSESRKINISAWQDSWSLRRESRYGRTLGITGP